MTEVTLIRHALVEPAWTQRCYGSRCDPGISPEGAAAAVQLARALPGVPRLVASPARRARETAQHLAAEFSIDRRWAERDFGEWEGRMWSECFARTPVSVTENAAAYVEYTPPGAEQFVDVIARVEQALTDYNAYAAVAVVTHAGPMRAALLLAGMPLDDVFAVDIPPCARITLLRAHSLSPTGRLVASRPCPM